MCIGIVVLYFLHIIKIFTTDDVTTDFYDVKISVY